MENAKKKHQQYSKVENVTKTLNLYWIEKSIGKQRIRNSIKDTRRNMPVEMDRIGEIKTNSSTTVSEKAGERKKSGRRRRRRKICYQELGVTFKNDRKIQENELHENNTM